MEANENLRIIDFMPRFVSSINNFSVVLGAGFCVYVAGVILSLGSEAIFHHELPPIGWAIPIYCGGKMLAYYSKIKNRKMMMCGLGYAGMLALILWYVFKT